MLKIIYFYTLNILFLIGTIPDIIRVKYLLGRGKTIQADSITNSKTAYWGKLVAKLSNTSVIVTGEENVPDDVAVVFVSNHTSMFDIPLLSGFISKPKAFLSKIEISKVPILSTWMHLMHCVFIERGNMKKGLEAITEGSEIVKKGYSMVLFPEGTRSRDGKLLKFKPGSLKLAINSGAPIVPVTLIGIPEILKSGRHTVKIIISPPIYEKDYSNIDTVHLAKLLQDTIDSKR